MTMWLGVLVVVGLAARAQAAPIDEAKKAFAEGKAAFERGDYEVALSAYQRANTLFPAPNLYYNIGAAYEKLGRYQEAALAFDAYFKLAPPPENDQDREFQDKLRARADADRKRPNEVRPPPNQPMPGQPVPGQPMPGQPQQLPPPAYYAPPGYYVPQPPPVETREMKIKNAKGRRTRAIVLMAIGLPLTVAGVAVTGIAATNDPNFVSGAVIGGEYFVGITLSVVGITLWAPGAASFVKSSRDLRDLSRPDPATGQRPQ